MFFLGDLFYTSKSERERFNAHVKRSPSAYTFKSTVRLKNVSGSGTSTVYAGGGKRQGGSNRGSLEYKYLSATVQDFSGFWGTVSYIWNGGNVDGISYNWNGEPIGMSPIMGVAPDVGFAKIGKIGTYAELIKDTKGFKGLIQAHHLIEKRFLALFRLDKLKSPAVILEKTAHQNLTKELIQKLPKNTRFDPDDVLETYKDVYKNYPEWLNEINKYIGN